MNEVYVCANAPDPKLVNTAKPEEKAMVTAARSAKRAPVFPAKTPRMSGESIATAGREFLEQYAQDNTQHTHEMMEMLKTAVLTGRVQFRSYNKSGQEIQTERTTLEVTTPIEWMTIFREYMDRIVGKPAQKAEINRKSLSVTAAVGQASDDAKLSDNQTLDFMRHLAQQAMGRDVVSTQNGQGRDQSPEAGDDPAAVSGESADLSGDGYSDPEGSAGEPGLADDDAGSDG